MYFKKCKSLLVENLVTPMPFFFASFFTSFKSSEPYGFCVKYFLKCIVNLLIRATL